ncbi:unnamed protein product [Trichogramma brassicae]|uniref:DUF5641 domain-containing protein n=1 Tax=Trichogramma brassicae TaxID=86971 RepID=A0A6H5IYN9_9HYME|nr:unnamed protein product [Trichogramma brassicae]
MGRSRVVRTLEEEQALLAARRVRNAENQRRRRQAARIAAIEKRRNAPIPEDYLGKMDTLCMHCNAKHFENEKVSNKGLSFNDCCSHGGVRLEPTPEFPPELRDLFNEILKYLFGMKHQWHQVPSQPGPGEAAQECHLPPLPQQLQATTRGSTEATTLKRPANAKFKYTTHTHTLHTIELSRIANRLRNSYQIKTFCTNLVPIDPIRTRGPDQEQRQRSSEIFGHISFRKECIRPEAPPFPPPGPDEKIATFIAKIRLLMNKISPQWSEKKQLDRIYENLHSKYLKNIKRSQFNNFKELILIGLEEESLIDKEQNYKPPPTERSLVPKAAYASKKNNNNNDTKKNEIAAIENKLASRSFTNNSRRKNDNTASKESQQQKPAQQTAASANDRDKPTRNDHCWICDASDHWAMFCPNKDGDTRNSTQKMTQMMSAQKPKRTKSPASLQREMDIAFKGMQQKDIFLYLDDAVIFAKTPEEHYSKLQRFLQRARKLVTIILVLENRATYARLDRPPRRRSAQPKSFFVGLLGRYDEKKFCLRKRYRVAQNLADEFWKRWIREYAPTLLKRSKWTASDEPLRAGDHVVVVDPNASRNVWLKGRVIETFPAVDGQVRVVKVRTRNANRFTRCNHRLTRQLVNFVPTPSTRKHQRQHRHRPALQQPAPAAHRHFQLPKRTTPPKKLIPCNKMLAQPYLSLCRCVFQSRRQYQQEKRNLFSPKNYRQKLSKLLQKSYNGIIRLFTEYVNGRSRWLHRLA